MEQQKKGKSGQLVDPRPEQVEGGDVKIRITPQLIHDIFDEYPVVAKAYNENVPEKVCCWVIYRETALKGLAALRGAVLDAIFSVQVIQRTPRLHSIGCHAACCQGRSHLRQVPGERR
jgi:hypothetical protein